MIRKITEMMNASIIIKTTVKISFVFILAILLVGIIVISVFYNEMERRIIADQQIIVEKIANNVNDPLDNLTAPIITLANNSSAISLLSQQVELYTPDWMRNRRNVELYLTNIDLFNTYIVDVALLRPDSTVVYSLSNVLKRDYDYCSQDWFKAAVASKNIIKFALPHGRDHFYLSSFGSDYCVSVIYPVERSSRLLGYILIEVDLTKLSDIFRDSSTNSYGKYLLVDGTGQVIYDYSHTNRDPKQLESVISGLLSTENHRWVANRQLFVGQQLPRTGWFVISETDYTVLTKPAYDIIRVVTILLIATVLLVLLVVNSITRSAKRPIQSLVERISSYDGSGSTELDNTHLYTGEFLLIRTKFEKMADKINSLINDVYLAQMHKREMELQALMNQINPHFLYNVLQLIQTKAVISGEHEIEDMINALGKMLRYTMDQKCEIVTVREEFAYIENYLLFYKARFEKLFSYDLTFDPILKNHLIPKFLLQPIVENCFKHGFRDLKQDGLIKIIAKVVESDCMIEISDNGQGISPARLEQLRYNLDHNITTESIGIINTHSRIRLVYGSPYGISIDSVAGQYTLIRVRLPFATINKEIDRSGKWS